MTRTAVAGGRPPRSAYACRVFYKPDGKKADDFQQVCSVAEDGRVWVVWTREGTVVYDVVWVHWLSGSAKELGVALCVERRRAMREIAA